jgi:hypothetical protein
MVKVGKYEYQKSTRPNKKLMVVVDGKTIHFGDRKMEQFKDKTGIWKSKDHGDKERRKRFLARAGGIKNKKGQLTAKMPSSANFHSINVLW